MKRLFFCYSKTTATFTISILMLLFVTTKTNAQVQHQEIDDMIKINTDNYDLGEVKQSCLPSDAVNTYFEITNISDKPVVIKIQSSWINLMLETSKETIAPNKTYKLKVTFTPCRNIGIFNKSVVITIDGVEKQVRGKTFMKSESKAISFIGKFAK